MYLMILFSDRKLKLKRQEVRFTQICPHCLENFIVDVLYQKLYSDWLYRVLV